MSDNKNNFDVTAHLKFILVPQAPTERCKADKKEKHVFITVAFFFWRGGGWGRCFTSFTKAGNSMEGRSVWILINELTKNEKKNGQHTQREKFL